MLGQVFNNAVVVVKPSEIFPVDRLLKLSLGALLQLAGYYSGIRIGFDGVLDCLGSNRDQRRQSDIMASRGFAERGTAPYIRTTSG